jgi:glutathione synthase/RimK-type ligase-like ATP-grasp enzyme
MRALGILRETQNSPNRESDDALILNAVMDQLSILKTETALLTPELFDRTDVSGYDIIVPMCETYPRLMRLKKIEAETGVMVINPSDSVLGCYRTRMLLSFAQTPGLSYPPTEVRRTTPDANAAAPAFEADGGYWVKRGDVHNTCSYDVVFARDWSEVDAIRREFESREIKDMAVQRHTDGDLIKFYGVGPGQWFTWFYHDPSTARRLPFELEDLAAQAELAAKAVAVEIFGGDAIITPDGKIFVIDINSWPSFARVRAEAAVQIARRLRARLRQAAASKPQRKA